MKGFFKALGRFMLKVGKTAVEKFVDDYKQLGLEIVYEVSKSNLSWMQKRENASANSGPSY